MLLSSHHEMQGAVPGHPRPALAVLIVVDQMRPDYFTRYARQFSGGLGRLYRTGAVYMNGLQDHALTQTAPGHASLLSGRPPASTNIFSNDRGVPDERSPLLEADGRGASPWRFRGTALYDWLRAADSGARVLSVSRKDRGAILPVGRARGNVYWYADGKFTTSTWYASTLPPWVRAWNDRGGVRALAGRVWRPLLPDTAYAEPDTMDYENGGESFVFPHVLPTDPAAVAAAVPKTPWMDSLTLDLALEGVRRLRLGRRGATDLLIVSLSATDEIGHRYGPDARELHDQLLRVDRWLGWFLDSLDALVPSDRMVLALSSDHGVVTMPEYAARVLHRSAGRLSLDPVVRALRRRYEAGRGSDFAFTANGGLLSADVRALAASGIAVDSLSAALAAETERMPGVARVLTPARLARAPAGDVEARRLRRQLPPGHPWLIAAVVEPGWIWGGAHDTGHGTSQPADVTVPIIIAGPGVRHGIYSRPVRVTDIGPTLAAMAGARPTEPVEGTPLRESGARAAR